MGEERGNEGEGRGDVLVAMLGHAKKNRPPPLSPLPLLIIGVFEDEVARASQEKGEGGEGGGEKNCN